MRQDGVVVSRLALKDGLLRAFWYERNSAFIRLLFDFVLLPRLFRRFACLPLQRSLIGWTLPHLLLVLG